MTEKKSDQPPVTVDATQVVEPVRDYKSSGLTVFDVKAFNIDNSMLPNAESLAKMKELGILDDILAIVKERSAHEMEVERKQLQNQELALKNQKDIAEIEATSVRDALGERRSQRVHSMMVVGGVMLVGVALLALGKDVGGYASIISALALLVGSLAYSKSKKPD